MDLLEDEGEEEINEFEEKNVDILFDQVEEEEEGCEDDDFKFSFE